MSFNSLSGIGVFLTEKATRAKYQKYDYESFNSLSGIGVFLTVAQTPGEPYKTHAFQFPFGNWSVSDKGGNAMTEKQTILVSIPFRELECF